MLIAGLVGQKSGTSWAEGRYVVQNAVGNGAFGTVWRAVEEASGETCAIKRVVLDDRYQNREARVHPFVCSQFHPLVPQVAAAGISGHLCPHPRCSCR